MGRVTLKKGRTGANTATGYEKVSALVGHFGTFEGAGDVGITPGTPVRLYNIEDCSVYGITQAGAPLLYRRISEYFRIGGRGATLWLLSITKGDQDTLASLPDSAAVKTMIAEADGDIFNMGFSFVPTQAPEYVNGTPTYLVEAIQAAQALADWTLETGRPLHIVLECADYKGPAASAEDLRALKVGEAVLSAPQVSVVVGQDYDFAATLTGQEQKHAAVGAVLGCMARQAVNKNIGEVETMGITDAPRGLWTNAGLSSHVTVKSVESDLDTLNAKGYIFGEYYSGVVCLNDDHNCVKEVVDAEGNINESTMSLSRTNAKIFRELYKTYLPKVKTTYPVGSDGKLTTGIIKYFEGLGNAVFDRLSARQEISAGQTTVDPNSDLLSGDRELRVTYDWVPTGTVRMITGTVNIKKSL